MSGLFALRLIGDLVDVLSLLPDDFYRVVLFKFWKVIEGVLSSELVSPV